MTSRLGKLLALGVLVLSGMVLALALMEIVVRLFFPEPILPRFVIDPGYGVRANQPNVITRHFVPNEYDIVVSTNSAGMRGTNEYETTKPENVYRIAVIGDSFVFGHGVNDDEVISATMESIFNERVKSSGQYAEVLNFGVSGFGQAEEIVTYENRVRQYKPDEVVIFYFSNDIGNNAVSRLFSIDSNGLVNRTENSYLPGVKTREMLYGITPIRMLFTKSQAWNLIRNRLAQIVQKRLLKKQGLKTFNDTKPEALTLTRALLSKFIEDIRKDGARATVVIIPENNLKTNFPLTEKEVYQSGAKLIDGSAHLTQADYYIRDSHWRPTGHRKIAKVIVDSIIGNSKLLAP